MPAYTVCGLDELDTGALPIAAVYVGHLTAVDSQSTVEERCGMQRWAEHVTAENPAEAERAARQTHRYGGPPHELPACRAAPGDRLVYHDGDTARIAAVEHTSHDDVHLTLHDEHTGKSSLACYDTSALLRLARPDD
jgi:hypothetical protein